jgi:cytochrome c-type biogenesis protein CcmH/NrfG
MTEVIMVFLLVKLRISNSLTRKGSLWCIARARSVLCLLLALNSSDTYSTVSSASGAECDRLASIAADPDHQSTPIHYEEIDGAAVIDSCRQAVAQSPNNARYWVQLGRGYLRLEQGEMMLDAFQKAKSLNYPVAWFALAVVYHTGNGIAEADLNRAEILYKEAYQRGVVYAALGLARLYDEPGSLLFDLDKANVWQSRFDALSNGLG